MSSPAQIAVLKSFSLLRQSFARSTIPSNILAFQSDLEERISNYNKQLTHEDPAKQVKDLPVLDIPKLNPIFEDFCKDGENYFAKNSTNAERYNDAIADYLYMKEKTTAELQILEANRVGVDKDITKIVTQTAGHVGLSMPKLYDPKK